MCVRRIMCRELSLTGTLNPTNGGVYSLSVPLPLTHVHVSYCYARVCIQMTVQKIKSRHRSSLHPKTCCNLYALLMLGRTFRCVCIPQQNTGQWVMQYTTLTACSLTLSGHPGQRQITCPIIPPRKRLSPDRLCDLGMQAGELSGVTLYSRLLRSIPYHIS